MSVLEALRAGEVEATVVQPRFVEPFPVWEFEQYHDRDMMVVETSATGMFASLIKEQTGLHPAAVIKRYDGRPFDPHELAAQIKGVS